MRATIMKRFEFEAAHRLVNHEGHCRRPHGHSYKVEVSISGVVSAVHGASDEGMVVDFHEVSKVFEERVFSIVDHQDLNEVLDVDPTTAENIAGWILREMRAGLAGIPVDSVTLWETSSGSVRVW